MLREKNIMLALVLFVLMATSAVARPGLPQEELEVLREDLEQDLEDLNDARAVDEAYERLYASPFAPGKSAKQATPSSGGSSEVANDYDYQGDQPLDDDEEDRATTFKIASPEHRAAGANNLASPDTSSPPSPSSSSEPNLAPNDGTGATTTGTTEEQATLSSAAIRKSERERDKQLHLSYFKNQVLNLLGLTSSSEHPINNMTLSQQQVLHVMKAMPFSNLAQQDTLAEKAQSHFPSCSLPRHTDQALWSGGNAMRLLFDLPNHPPQDGTKVNVVQATLRLYKVSQGNGSSTAAGPLCLTPPSSASGGADTEEETDAAPLDTTLDQFAQPGGPLTTLIGMTTSDERLVRVSVYWYFRPLKMKNGAAVVKRKLLDSRMLPMQGSSWTQWNVRPAVRVWRESGRNFGLVVEVEDEDGNELNAHQFFNGMNCTQEASTARPLPSFLLDRLYHSNAAGGAGGSGRPAVVAAASGPEALAFNQNLFPVIDIRTVEVTDDGAASTLYSSSYETGLGSTDTSRQQRNHPRHTTIKLHIGKHATPRHRHRHQHQQGEDDMEPVARRWPRADDIRSAIIPHGIVLTAKQLLPQGSTPSTHAR